MQPGKAFRKPFPWKRAGSYALMTLWSLLVLTPIWIMVINSFKPKLAIYRDPLGLPDVFTMSGYTAIFSEGNFFTYFMNSVIIVAVSILIIMLFASLAAYAIVRWNNWIARGFTLFFLAGLMIPIRIGSINLMQIVKTLGLMDNLWGLLPVYAAMGMPLAVFVLTAFMRTVPRELIHAAYIDGAADLRIFFQILLPLTRPALATVAIFNLVTLWNDLWFPLIFIRKESQRTLMLGVTRLFGQYQTDWTSILATLTLASVPILLLYLLMAKQFIQGLTAGAIKG
jgi:raffinose/stachyose/melibiose transport system permease protein